MTWNWGRLSRELPLAFQDSRINGSHGGDPCRCVERIDFSFIICCKAIKYRLNLSAESLYAVEGDVTQLEIGHSFKASNQCPFAEVGLHHKSFGALVPCAQVLISVIDTRAALPSNLPICAAVPCRLENVGAPPLFPSRGKLEKSFQ